MLPKLIDLGGFFIPTYGVLVALAFLSAIWLTGKLARQVGLSSEKTTNLAIYCAIAGMIGAKLFMFIFDWRVYAADPGQLFTLSTLQAAGVYQGGLLLAILTAVLYTRRQGMPGLLTSDVFAPGLALGHAIGRIGCFAAGCCWGSECNLPWAVTFRNPEANELTGVPLGVPLHPSQLYESFGELLIFGFLLWYFRRVPREGTVIGWYLVLYSGLRFAIEFVRHHDQSLVSGLSLTQWISIATFCAGVWLLIRRPAFMAPQPAGD
jgi:phosphatidylglycerol:prolipoprotein diacylglycerol transferase